MKKSGKGFDPMLVKAFVNFVGLYPIGTIVRLNTGEVAVVYEPCKDPEFNDRPKVRLVRYEDGKATAGEIVDLMERDDSGKKFKRTITDYLKPSESDINVSHFILK
jgi:hypothetical protein